MATANLQKRKGIRIRDFSRMKKLEKERVKKLSQTVPKPPVFIPPTVAKPKLEEEPIQILKKTDIADKKVKSLFKHLNDSGIEQPDKLLDFVRWYALPRQLRKPETQEKLSEKIGIHKDTFVNWKRRAGFWDEVAIYRGQFGRSYVSDALYALIRNAKQTGDPRAVKIILQ